MRADPQPGSACSLFLPSTSSVYGLAVPPLYHGMASHPHPASPTTSQPLPLLTPSLIPKKNKKVGSQSVHGCLLKKRVSGVRI